MFTRHRSKSIPGREVPAAWTISPREPDGPQGATYFTSAVLGKEDVTIDDIFAPYGTGVWPYKPCYLVQRQESYTPMTGNITGPLRVPNQHPGCESCFAVSNAKGDWYPSVFWMKPMEEPGFGAGIDTLTWRKLDKKIEEQWPSLKGQLPDLAVFLSELADFKTVLEYTYKKWSMTVNALLKKGAEARLINSFVVKPGLSDIKSISKNLLNWRKRLHDLFEGAGKIHEIQASVTQPASSTEEHLGICGSPAFDNSIFTYGCGSWSRKHYESVRVKAVIKFKYELPDSLEVAEKSLSYILASLGLLPTIESAWEKVPFSFVLDWFLNTSLLFRHIKLGADSLISIKVVDICVVIRRATTIRDTMRSPCALTAAGHVIRRQSMERIVGRDLEEFLPIFNLPSFSQSLTALALGTALSLK